jgi:hypothetical protein
LNRRDAERSKDGNKIKINRTAKACPEKVEGPVLSKSKGRQEKQGWESNNNGREIAPIFLSNYGQRRDPEYLYRIAQ